MLSAPDMESESEACDEESELSESDDVKETLRLSRLARRNLRRSSSESC